MIDQNGRDEMERCLWTFVMRAALLGTAKAAAAADRARHLIDGVRAGVDVEEVLERIEAGELAVV